MSIKQSFTENTFNEIRVSPLNGQFSSDMNAEKCSTDDTELVLNLSADGLGCLQVILLIWTHFQYFQNKFSIENYFDLEYWRWTLIDDLNLKLKLITI